MKYKKLGTTNIDVSLICLGTMTWGTQNNEKDAFEQMNYSLEKGVNFLTQQNCTLCRQMLSHMAKLRK